MSGPLLSVRELSVTHGTGDEARPLLHSVSLDLAEGEVLGLVGESGSGKSLLSRMIIGLPPSRLMRATSGRVMLGGRDLLQAGEAAMRSVRGREIGMIFQNPTSHLDPVMRVGDQLVEGLARHRGLDQRAARAEAVAILDRVGFPEPERQFSAYPHEFSGGMRQRAMIGIALACAPKILIADEPTTALDVTIQAQILQLLMDLRRERGLSIILITHDLGIVAQTCDRIAVMQGGRLVEEGEKRALLRAPQESYTRTLIASHPSMPAPDGGITTGGIATGGAAPAAAPPAGDGRTLLRIEGLDVRFAGAGGFLSRGARSVHAVRGVSLSVREGETLGIVGESGSGKSTLARAVLGLAPVSGGDVVFDGTALRESRAQLLSRLRREAAMVFQDPYNALNPRLTVGAMLAEVLRVQRRAAPADIPARVSELLDLVELGRDYAGRLPRSLSGGQCQRAGIARALAAGPRLIIADESTAALDVTIQAQILALFRSLKERMNLTLIFIAHDLAIVRNLCDRVVVMSRGEVVEQGPAAEVFENPREAYTRALVRAVPDIDPDHRLLN